jgi:hypothetical protein
VLDEFGEDFGGEGDDVRTGEGDALDVIGGAGGGAEDFGVESVVVVVDGTDLVNESKAIDVEIVEATDEGRNEGGAGLGGHEGLVGGEAEGHVDHVAVIAGEDAAGLEATVGKFNQYARDGVDPDFNRGGQNYDLYYGDREVGPNTCLGPLQKAPYYGVKVYPGELGTKGGLKTDIRARVLNEADEVIAGLYAIGNCSAPVTGSTYPASGATLGPAMVFGYIAGADAASS